MWKPARLLPRVSDRDSGLLGVSKQCLFIIASEQTED